MKKSVDKWEYAVLQFKTDMLILNPEVLPESQQKEYKNTVDKFLDSYATILKIHTSNPDISSKAYSEVYGEKKG